MTAVLTTVFAGLAGVLVIAIAEGRRADRRAVNAHISRMIAKFA